MLQATALRTGGLADTADRCLVVSNEAHRFSVAEQLAAIEMNTTIILEPEGRNTAPAVALAALWAVRDGDDAVVWSRSAWAGSQRSPVHWSGDGVARWQDLACVVRSMLSIGLSGIPFYAHDVGGVVRRLVGFEKVAVAAGSSETAVLEIPWERFRWWDPAEPAGWRMPDGDVVVSIRGAFGETTPATVSAGRPA